MWREAHWRDVEIDTWVLARYGELVSAGEFAWMRDLILAQGRLMHQFHQRHDVLLTPVVSQLPATHLTKAQIPSTSRIANTIGKPTSITRRAAAP